MYARKGWFPEDLVRDAGAPNGTSETLVDAALRQAAEDFERSSSPRRRSTIFTASTASARRRSFEDPAIVVRVLAALLVPGTLVLALADGPHFFPAAWVR